MLSGDRWRALLSADTGKQNTNFRLRKQNRIASFVFQTAKTLFNSSTLLKQDSQSLLAKSKVAKECMVYLSRRVIA